MKKLGTLALATFLILPTIEARAVEIEFERDNSLPLVYLSVAVKTGTISDPSGQSGISSFVAKMLMRGTKSRTKEQIDLAFDQMGGRLEVETRAEALILRGSVLAASLDRYLDLVQDIVTAPSFPEHEIRKLKSETVSEILEEVSNDTRLGRRAYERFLFRDHPYGKPILGTTRDIQGLTRAQILAHYDRLFRDQQLLVVATGDADESKVRDWAKSIGKLRPGESRIQEVAKPEMPPQRRLLLVDKPDRTQTQINAGQIGIRMTDDDFFPLYVANHAFGGGSFSARMMRQIRVERGWSYGAYSFFRHGREPRSWQMYTFPATSYTPEALTYLMEMLRKLKTDGITQEEFEFAKASLVNSAGFSFNTPKKRVENALLEKTINLPEGFIESFGPKIEKVTLAQVNDAIRKYFDPARISIVVVGTVTPEFKEAVAKAVGVQPEQAEVRSYTAE